MAPGRGGSLIFTEFLLSTFKSVVIISIQLKAFRYICKETSDTQEIVA